eukprot:5620999-Prymnesium_polylepis.1
MPLGRPASVARLAGESQRGPVIAPEVPQSGGPCQHSKVTEDVTEHVTEIYFRLRVTGVRPP